VLTARCKHKPLHTHQPHPGGGTSVLATHHLSPPFQFMHTRDRRIHTRQVDPNAQCFGQTCGN
jgi:hypothetical protein